MFGAKGLVHGWLSPLHRLTLLMHMSQKLKHERKQFLKTNIKQYIRSNVEIIVVGDFNFTISDIDHKDKCCP